MIAGRTKRGEIFHAPQEIRGSDGPTNPIPQNSMERGGEALVNQTSRGQSQVPNQYQSAGELVPNRQLGAPLSIHRSEIRPSNTWYQLSLEILSDWAFNSGPTFPPSRPGPNISMLDLKTNSIQTRLGLDDFNKIGL